MWSEVLDSHSIICSQVPGVRLEKMLRILQQTLKGRTVDEAVTIISQEYNIDPNQDLNKLSDEQLAKKKEVCVLKLL